MYYVLLYYVLMYNENARCVNRMVRSYHEPLKISDHLSTDNSPLPTANHQPTTLNQELIFITNAIGMLIRSKFVAVKK